MKFDTTKTLQKKKKQIPELWMKNQLVDFSLREDLMSNAELSVQSEELVDVLLQTLNNASLVAA
jgi:rsbT co-antagonist protein RsbR